MNGLLNLKYALKRSWLLALIAFASVIGSAILYAAITQPIYRSSGRLLLNEQLAGVSNLSDELNQFSDPRNTGANPLVTQSELIKSQKVLERALYIYNSKVASPEDLSPGELRPNLEVVILPATNILEVTYQYKDPEIAAQVLDAILQAAYEENIEYIKAEASVVREFLEDEVPNQEALLERAVSDESQFRQATGIVDLPNQKEALIARLSDIQAEENNLSFQIQEMGARIANLQQVTGVSNLESAYASVRAGQDEKLSTVRSNLIELEEQVIAARSRLGSQNPDLLALEEQREEVAQEYANELGRVLPSSVNVPDSLLALDQLSQDSITQYISDDIQLRALQNRLDTVQRTRADLESLISQVPSSEQSLSSLVRKREAAEATLQQLRSQLDEARIAEAQLISNIRILDAASVPSSAAWPKIPVILVFAIAGGLALATVLVILREMLNVTFDDPGEVEEFLGMPALGFLPELPAQAKLLDQPESFIHHASLVEPYRALLKAMHSKAANGSKIFLVTSAIAEDGKSTVASHLAAVAATFSYRTLLIDADLLQSTQQFIFAASQRPGINNIVNENVPFSECIQSTKVANLSLLTSGDKCLQPSVTIESAEFKHILETAAAQFDLVVIDSPSLATSADAMTLASQSDGILLVARQRFTPKALLKRVTSALRGSGGDLLGFVINRDQDSHDTFYPVFDTSSNATFNHSRNLQLEPLEKQS
jgi:succinoglycan biosynthesis transport protein ExoP